MGMAFSYLTVILWTTSYVEITNSHVFLILWIHGLDSMSSQIPISKFEPFYKVLECPLLLSYSVKLLIIYTDLLCWSHCPVSLYGCLVVQFLSSVYKISFITMNPIYTLLSFKFIMQTDRHNTTKMTCRIRWNKWKQGEEYQSDW